MNWLPPVDAAKTPRGAVTGAHPPRAGRGENPYIPRGMRQRSTHTAPDRIPHPPNAPPPHEDSYYGGASGAYSGKGRPHPAGSQTAREAVVANAIQQRGSQSARSIASAGASSPRSTAYVSDSEIRAAKQKRQERLLDNYQTNFARETLLSEQYDKELETLRSQMSKAAQVAPPGLAVKAEQHAERTKAKLARRVGGFEEKLNELDTYNEKLVATISGLRKQGEPRRKEEKRISAAVEKLNFEMMQLKGTCHKSLDERERCVELLRRVQDESHRDAADFEAHRHSLKLEAEELDRSIKEMEALLDGKQESAKRAQCMHLRDARRKRERLEVRYGYLRSQLEGLENDFVDLQRIVGVHFEPSRPESLQEIIEKFAEKERRVASLQQYWALQADEIETTSSELGGLEKQAAAAAADAAAHDAAEADTTSHQLSAEADEARQLKTIAQFDAVCDRIGAMFTLGACEKEPTVGAFIATKGCSASTILEYMACLGSAIDEAQGVGTGLRDAAQAHRAAASRKPNDTLESFLRKPPPPEPEGGAPAASADVLAVEHVLAMQNAEARKALKEELPSISDLGPGDADGDDGGDRGSMRQHGKKGSIDRQKRDQVIASWVARQQQVREAKGGGIRDFYMGDGVYGIVEERDPEPTSPVASAR